VLGVLLVVSRASGWPFAPPTAESVREALAVAHDWLAARPEIDRSRIIGYGRSLGGAAICTLIGHRALAALVLSSTFTSLRPFAWRMLAPPVLLRDAFDTLAAIRRFAGPILVVHGSIDELIPYAQGQALAAASERTKLLSYRAGHNDCPPDAEQFAADFLAFLSEHGLLAAR
jgi:fermentation-respiration switch protein FrsA (DUF1100 family)